MQRDDDIFADALELPPGERAAFLDRACAGDPARRDRLEALLAAHHSARDFLDRPLTARPELPGDPVAGDKLGRYTLRRQIGEGGHGIVWLAEQHEPLRRLVSLKVIKLGMDTRSVIARFESERQTLALMSHPDIAQVFDAGATDTGRPYFVMEYVEGVPITRFCDEQSLPLAARLELFTRVCLALQHAHQKGIIHRDLKPSNILVALRDGVPAPKIIDFGIAKATQGRSTGQTLLTELGQFIGTPAYMSPEQAELGDPDIDTRSDVYSLGVILYELLTGRPPHDPKSLVQAGLAEIRRIIREIDPPRPSTAVATLTNADRATVARLRGAAAIKLTSVLRGDLDWIVMRCLEKNRDRRYGTASDLAEDVRRHLRHEPVTARPPQALYQLRKFIARHRVACASAAVVAAALVGGTVISLQQAARAARAEHEATVQRDTAVAAARAATRARADAQRRQEQSEELLAFMLGDFRAGLEKIGRLDLLDAVGTKALAHFTALDPRDLTDTALEREARALTQLGEVRMSQARYSEAAEAFAAADARAAALVTRHPENGDMLYERGQAEYWTGFVARRRGDFATERTWLTRYRDTALALLAAEGPTARAQLEVVSGHHNLAIIEADHGSLADAERGLLAERAALEKMIAANPSDGSLHETRANAVSWLGTVAERDGRYEAAATRYAEAAALYVALNARDANATRWGLDVILCQSFVGRIQSITGRRAEATATYTKAEADHAALVARDPKNKRWSIALLSQRLRLAGLQLALAEGPVTPPLSETRAQLEALVTAEPSSLNANRLLANAWRLEAQAAEAAGALAEAAADADRARKIGEALLQKDRSDTAALSELALSALVAGRIERRRGDEPAAQAHWLRARSVLPASLDDVHDWRVLEPAAVAATCLGHTAEAAELTRRLKNFGFEPTDPLNAATLGLGQNAPSQTHPTAPN